jgi:hypothetical protein
MVRSVSITDTQFRIGVGVAGIALVAGIAAVRFCGRVSLPPRPPPPAVPHGTSSELLTRSSASPVVYQDLVARDAAEAGVRAPALDEMSRKLPYRVDEDALALEIANATGTDIAYDVVTAPLGAACSAAPARAFHAMTIHPHGREIRVECAWHEGIALAVSRVETVEVPPLSWYLDHVPPSAVGLEPRFTRGHLAPETGARCTFAMPQAVRSGLERGEIGWRDLIGFYARHRCQTYQFPLSYGALEQDGEHSMPRRGRGHVTDSAWLSLLLLPRTV